MSAKRTATAPALSPSDVSWIHEQLAASAIASGGRGGLQLVRVDDLSPDPANVRLHPEKNHEATRASLKRFGQRTPIVVQRQGMIVRAGNDRLRIFLEEGSIYRCGRRQGHSCGPGSFLDATTHREKGLRLDLDWWPVGSVQEPKRPGP